MTAAVLQENCTEEMYQAVYPPQVNLAMANAADDHNNRVEAAMANNLMQVSFENMFEGQTVALCMANETESDLKSKATFRLVLNKNSGAYNLGPVKGAGLLVTLNQVMSVDKDSKKITWSYLCPTTYSLPKHEKKVGPKIATRADAFHTRCPKRITCDFDEDEIVMSWDLDKDDIPTCIPTEQYKDAVIQMEAIMIARDSERR